MSVDLRRTYIGVPEELLDGSEVGAALEQVGGVGVPQSVGMEGAAVGERMPGEHPPRVPGGQAVAAGVHEERGRGVS